MTTFETLYPNLGAEIAGNAPKSDGSSPKWWETLLSQTPDILGVILKKDSGQPQFYPAPGAAQESILSTNNLVKIAVVAIVLIIAYKLIQKL